MNGVLLTGGAGYIGSHVAVELINAGFSPVIIDNFSNSSSGSVDNIKKITGIRPPLISGDVLKAGDLRTVFKRFDFCGVIHLAGLKSVSESLENPLRYYSNNVAGTIQLLNIMSEFEVTNLVFSSSATVYGHDFASPLLESYGRGRPLNPYGSTKASIEQILEELAEETDWWSIVSLRYFNPIGAHSTSLMGESPRARPTNVMPLICRAACQRDGSIQIFGDDYDTPDGTPIRDYIHIQDLARGHVAALNYSLEASGYEALNLGTGKGYSVLDLIWTFESTNEISVPYTVSTRRKGDVGMCVADPSKAKELIDWYAVLGLEDMCRDAWRWHDYNKKSYL